MALQFDEASHTYTWEGRRVPSVTQVMASACLTDYSMVPADTLERARQQGKAIHAVVEWELKRERYVCPEWLLPYRGGIQRFIEESGLELWQSEHKMYHQGLAYAGTADIIGLPHRFKDPRPSVFDVKRSFAGGQAIGVQTSGYAGQWNEEFKHDRNLQIKRRYGVCFMENGQYRCQPFESSDDFAVFLACLQIHRWKEKYK